MTCFVQQALYAENQSTESLEDSENLPDPDVLAQEMIEDLETALEQIREIAGDLTPATD